MTTNPTPFILFIVPFSGLESIYFDIRLDDSSLDSTAPTKPLIFPFTSALMQSVTNPSKPYKMKSSDNNDMIEAKFAGNQYSSKVQFFIKWNCPHPITISVHFFGHTAKKWAAKSVIAG